MKVSSETISFIRVILLIFSYILHYITETIRERNDPSAKLKSVSNETKEILAELERDYKPKETTSQVEKPMPDKFNAVSS